MPQGTCSIEGCTRNVVARKLCRTHYSAWNRHNADVVAADKASRSRDGRVCAIEDCGKPVRSREWCSTHYRRWVNYGDAEVDLRAHRGKPCRTDGCEKPNASNGLCGMHAYRLRMRGEVGAAERERDTDVIHGTVRGYKHRGCRCAECCEAKRLAELQWRAENRDTYRLMQTRYRDANREQIAAYRRRWKLANPDRARKYADARAAAPFDAKAIEYAEIIRNDPCVYCGSPATEIDHIVPVTVSRSSAWDNLAPACDGCNSSKGAKSLLGYLTYRLNRAPLAA